MKKEWKEVDLPLGIDSKQKALILQANSIISFIIKKHVPLGWEALRPYTLYIVLNIPEVGPRDVLVSYYVTEDDAKAAAYSVLTSICK